MTVIWRPMGGLGNQLFQYAAAFAVARRNRLGIAHTLSGLAQTRAGRRSGTRFDYELGQLAASDPLEGGKKAATAALVSAWGSNQFATTSVNLMAVLMQALNLKSRILMDRHDLEANWRNLRDSSFDTVYMLGNWQHSSYFEDADLELKRQLDFGTRARNLNQNLMSEIAQPEVVCVHARLGDFVGSKKMAQLGRAYYEESIARLQESSRTRIQKIVLFSDDPRRAREILRDIAPLRIIDKEMLGTPEANMVAMSRAANLVISNSTFSWWSAYLGSGRVCAPLNWYRDGRKFKVDIPSRWLTVDNVV